MFNSLFKSRLLALVSNNGHLPQRRCAGFSLLEVLISMALFGFAMLGLAQTQIFNARLSYDSLNAYQANLLLSTARERILASRELMDISAWQKEVASTLPSAQGVIVLAPDLAKIEVKWQESVDSGLPNSDQSIEVTIRLSAY